MADGPPGCDVEAAGGPLDDCPNESGSWQLRRAESPEVALGCTCQVACSAGWLRARDRESGGPSRTPLAPAGCARPPANGNITRNNQSKAPRASTWTPRLTSGVGLSCGPATWLPLHSHLCLCGEILCVPNAQRRKERWGHLPGPLLCQGRSMNAGPMAWGWGGRWWARGPARPPTSPPAQPGVRWT